jgi:DNA-binding CsgD family transcriptional regulator
LIDELEATWAVVTSLKQWHQNGDLDMKPIAPPRRDVSQQTAFLSADEWDALRRMLSLSERQAEICVFILSDCSEAQIADGLGISCHTVHSHLERLYRKLAVKSRTELLVHLFQAYVHFSAERSVDRGESEALPIARRVDPHVAVSE